LALDGISPGEMVGKMTEIKSNMTGTILEVLVKVGDGITEGQDLFSIESMKMEMAISSDFDGTVKEIKVSVEDFIQEGQVLLVLE
jgi:acetyl-CoA carboxylase biotin carboxyl carrier protein